MAEDKFRIGKFPIEIFAEIYANFLDLKSLVRLDTALCERAIRPAHSAALAKVFMTQNDKCQIFGIAYDRFIGQFDVNRGIAWFVKKGISVGTLMIPPFCARFSFPEITHPPLLQHLGTLQIIEWQSEHLEWWKHFFSMCPTLTELRVYGTDVTLSDSLKLVAQHFHQLEILDIRDRSNPALSLFDYYDWERDSAAVLHVLDTCTKLKKAVVMGYELMKPKIEPPCSVVTRYMKNQDFINEKMRCILVDWLVRRHKYYTTINIIL